MWWQICPNIVFQYLNHDHHWFISLWVQADICIVFGYKWRWLLVSFLSQMLVSATLHCICSCKAFLHQDLNAERSACLFRLASRLLLPILVWHLRWLPNCPIQPLPGINSGSECVYSGQAVSIPIRLWDETLQQAGPQCLLDTELLNLRHDSGCGHVWGKG